MKILLTILGICYVLSPYDVIPDFIVGLGWLDDVVVLGLLWKFLYQKQFFQGNARKRFSGNAAHGFGSRPVQ